MLTEEENISKAYSLLREFGERNGGRNKILAAFDFDELLVSGHLSKAVIDTLQGEHARKEILAQHPDNSFEAIQALSTCAVQGLSEKEATARKTEIVCAVPWREGAEDLLRILQEDERYTPLILSCGRYRPIRIKLEQAGLENIPVIATEVMYQNSTAINRYIITEEIKGEAMRFFSGHFKKIYAYGHSKGDIPMLKESDIAVALKENPRNKEVEKTADHTVDNLIEGYFVLKL